MGVYTPVTKRKQLKSVILQNFLSAEVPGHLQKIKNSMPTISHLLPFGKHVSLFYNDWKEIALYKWVLSTVKEGYVIQFASFSFSNPLSLSLFRDLSHKTILLRKCDHL